MRSNIEKILDVIEVVIKRLIMEYGLESDRERRAFIFGKITAYEQVICFIKNNCKDIEKEEVGRGSGCQRYLT